VPDPKQHADDRGVIESILRYIPGFRGYLEKEYRRESDSLARTWLADRLDRSKRYLDDYGRALVDAGQIDGLPQVERLRNRLDKVLARIQGAVHGYSGFFDFVRVDEDLLDDVYDHDMSTMDDVDALAQSVEALSSNTPPPGEAVPQLLRQLEMIEQRIDKRADLLKGLGPDE